MSFIVLFVEDGSSSVRLANGARVNYFPCSLSSNGTNMSRGQIPYLQYAIHTQKKNTHLMDSEKVGGRKKNYNTFFKKGYKKGSNSRERTYIKQKLS